MSPDLALIIVVVVFFVLLFAECPVAFSLAASGSLGIFLLRDGGMVTAQFAQSPFNVTASYSLAIIPMYILLGMFALHGKLAPRMYVLADKAFQRLPGGLGIATVGACAGFAAVTGSSVATAATIGKISVREMNRHGYPVPFAAGIVAAAGTLGVLIPPSIVLVLYGILADESIQELLLAGIIPGILSAILYMIWILFRGNRVLEKARSVPEAPGLANALTSLTSRSGPASGHNPGDGMETPGTLTDISHGTGEASFLPAELEGGEDAEQELEERDKRPITLLRAAAWVVAIFVVILAGIYTGQFTVIESGGLGALLALTMLLVETGRDGARRTWGRVKSALLDTAGTTSMAFAILIGATIFTFFLVLARVPMRFTSWVVGLDAAPIVILAVLLLALIPLGMALETLSVLIIAVPLVHPIVIGLGFEGVWFAILFVKMIEIGLVTPPVGMNCYIVAGAASVPPESVFKGVAPFVAIDLVTVVLLVVFPSIVLWLPGFAAG